MEIDEKRKQLETEIKDKVEELLGLIGIADAFLLNLKDGNIVCAGDPVGVEQLAKMKKEGD